MRRFYALVMAAYGRPQDPTESARLEVEWWRVHREAQHGVPGARDELVYALARLYAFVFGVADSDVRPAAVHRCAAMEISDQWVARAAARTAPCSPWSGPPWSGRIQRCSLRSITELTCAQSPTAVGR